MVPLGIHSSVKSLSIRVTMADIHTWKSCLVCALRSIIAQMLALSTPFRIQPSNNSNYLDKHEHYPLELDSVSVLDQLPLLSEVCTTNSFPWEHLYDKWTYCGT